MDNSSMRSTAKIVELRKKKSEQKKSESNQSQNIVLNSVRIKIGHFINNKLIQFCMIIVALYALLGEDIRVIAFDKADDGFF